MFTKTMAKKATNWLVAGGAVKAEEGVVYEFGLDKLFSFLINFFFAMMFGLLLGIFWQTTVFYLSYLLLRVYAGGYHAEKPLTCFFVSIAILIPCLIGIRFHQAWASQSVFWSLAILSVGSLLILCPVEHKNKRLDAMEKRVYRKRMIRNLIIILAIMGVFLISSFHIFSVAVLCGILLTAITAIAGKVKGWKRNWKV